MTFKNTLKILAALFLIFIILVLYSFINGIPFGGYIAKAKLSAYAEQVYGITGDIQMPRYNLKDSYYTTSIQHENNEIRISYNLMNNTIYDAVVADTYRSLFERDYKKMLEAYTVNIELPAYADIYTEIIANGKYSNDIYQLTCIHKMYLLGIINRGKPSPEDSLELPAKITMDIINRLSSSIDITSVQIFYTDLNGPLEIVANGKAELNVRKLRKHTSKPDRIAETTKELLKELDK